MKRAALFGGSLFLPSSGCALFVVALYSHRVRGGRRFRLLKDYEQAAKNDDYNNADKADRPD